jgi:hypothetical protein
MGFGPREVDALSMWEFTAIVDAWNEAHSDKKTSTPLSEAEMNELSRMMEQDDGH